MSIERREKPAEFSDKQIEKADAFTNIVKDLTHHQAILSSFKNGKTARRESVIEVERLENEAFQANRNLEQNTPKKPKAQQLSFFI